MSVKTVHIRTAEMLREFNSILTAHGFDETDAGTLAQVFTDNSLEGVYTHGVNRFPRFIQYVKKGLVDIHARPERVHRSGGVEQWEGHRAAGILNALAAAARSVELAREHGIGCVALARTNHWMRGGTYGRKVAEQGMAFIGWTNTVANMPAWGAVDPRLGNNPLVVGMPFKQETIVLDMAMSQYSFGSLELKKMRGESLQVPGGYDQEGSMSIDPAAIMQSGRVMPAGYWKGAGLSLLLDILAAALSGGKSVREITAQGDEYDLSQVFISIALDSLSNGKAIADMLNEAITDYCASDVPEGSSPVRYPGQNIRKIREENNRTGIPVIESVWDEVLRCRA